jgi:YjjG family noncanonical pyrimidine nucleotidase
MTPYTWLLFDADGTLFDFDKAEALALARILEDLQLEFSSDAHIRYKTINQQLWHSFELGHLTQEDIKAKRFELWLAELALSGDVQRISRDYLRHLSEQDVLLEQAHEVIENLSKRYSMMIITNGLKEVQRPRFERSSLRPYFTDIIVSGELGVAKPEAGIFDAAFEKMGNPSKTSVLMIGDSLSADMQGGIRYGIDTCWCNFGNGQTDLPVTHTITRLEQLAKLL